MIYISDLYFSDLSRRENLNRRTTTKTTNQANNQAPDKSSKQVIKQISNQASNHTSNQAIVLSNNSKDIEVT